VTNGSGSWRPKTKKYNIRSDTDISATGYEVPVQVFTCPTDEAEGDEFPDVWLDELGTLGHHHGE
jgi:hypothetical protein